MNLVPIAKVDDWERRLDRQDAYWDRVILDRLVVCMELPRHLASAGLPALEDPCGSWRTPRTSNLF